MCVYSRTPGTRQDKICLDRQAVLCFFGGQNAKTRARREGRLGSIRCSSLVLGSWAKLVGQSRLSQPRSSLGWMVTVVRSAVGDIE